MTNTKTTGARGEVIAGEFLIKKGYKITEKNFRSGRYEIDIIATKQNMHIFFEVKTRFKNNMDKGDIPLSSHQVNNLKQAIVGYCLKNRVCLEQARLDLIVITIDQATRLASLKHYLNIT